MTKSCRTQGDLTKGLVKHEVRGPAQTVSQCSQAAHTKARPAITPRRRAEQPAIQATTPIVRNIQQKFHRSDTDTLLFPGSYGNLNQSPALQDLIRGPQRDDPWAPENASYAYGQRSDGTYNSPYNSFPGNDRYNNPYNNNQYDNNPYNNNPYTNNPYNDDPYNNNNPADHSSGVPPYANRNGRIPNGDSNNSRSNNTYGSDYETTYGRSSNSENNQNNTSNNRSRNNPRR